ncbi:MAG TPA: hypothetical protein VKQ29_02680, partial [Aliidongia sp.]|nr:hypothetical protein [Aliidongia sp.]
AGMGNPRTQSVYGVPAAPARRGRAHRQLRRGGDDLCGPLAGPGFDAEAVHREFGLAEDEVPVLLLSIGAERPGNWPQKPRRPVADVLDLV